MKNSELLNDILVKADKIRSDANFQYISAPCILVAVKELCQKEYTGITPYDKSLYPEFFEEERLRYLFSKLLKGRGTTVLTFAGRHMAKKYSQYDTDFLSAYADDFEAVAKSRKKSALSADIVFMYAVKDFEPIHHLLLQPQYAESVSVSDMLADVDKNVYDFVIDSIESLKLKLENKANEAKNMRDWCPAEKFTEPDQLLCKFFDYFRVEENEKSIDLTIPGFFGNDSTGLKLTFVYKDNCYFVHDNGCALSVLKNNAGENYDKVLKSISIPFAVQQPFIYGDFSQFNQFFCYLKKLIFIANADLLYNSICTDAALFDQGQKDVTDPGNIDADKFIASIKESFKTDYNENKGLIFIFPRIYRHSTIPAVYQIETLDENKIKISDYRKGCAEGDIFDNFYFCHDDISLFADFISVFTERFGGDFDGKDISITAEITDSNFVPALLRFVNIAVLLSEFAGHISIPDIKK